MAMNKMAVFMIMALCAVPAYAAKYACPATDGPYIDSDLNTPATYACADRACLDLAGCVLPTGLDYYDDTGRFKSVCDVSIDPEFLKDPKTDKCPDGTYDIPGIDQCIDATPDVRGFVYWEFTGPSAQVYGLPSNSLTAPGQWVVQLYTKDLIKGAASCVDDGYCWCQMTDPVRLNWAYFTKFGDNCGSNCTYACVAGLRDYVGVRERMFSSAGQTSLQCDAGTCDLGLGRCIDASTGGNSFGYINPAGSSSKADDYGLTENGTWGVTFSYGKIKGVALCSMTPETDSDGELSNTEGENCWCKATSSIDLVGQEYTLPESHWVYVNGYDNASVCAYNCAYRCGFVVQDFLGFRSDVFAGGGRYNK